ncbi:MAG: alpha-amylase [Bacteroidia bacterium]|nr:MAG: alpha-amylase [Bacteroidia bacterium]
MKHAQIRVMTAWSVTVFSLTASFPLAAQENASPSVPEWSKHVVWYQIFPERFRNGDPSNDPTPEDLSGSWPHVVPKGWQVSSWTGDWYELQPWERDDGKGFYVHVQNRRYGGDLQGVLDKLDYLQQLGVTALYFNPLFESPSLHKYDATMYHHIDNNFGPDPVGDRAVWAMEQPGDPSTWQWTSADRLFLRLVQEAHKRNMKIILDGVFNHVGMTFWAFEDVKKHQQQSAYADWFIIKRWDDPSTPENEFEYQGWYGVRELPELREDENGIVTGPREHIRAIVKRWMDPNGDGNPEDGIDGWRLDVAEMVNRTFWREFRRWVRAVNPEAYLTGEVWWEDWNNEKMFNAAPWLQGDVFDAVMNYRWARECFRFFAADRTRISAPEFLRRLESLLRDYPADVNLVLQNLYDSHDTDRLASHIVNTDALYDKHVDANGNRKYNVRKPTERERAAQKLMALFQMVFVGAPMIYYGTEAGMWGGDDPDCRKPMLWPDMRFDDEKSHPFNLERPADVNRFDEELFTWYSRLIKLRTSHPVLRTGAFEPIPLHHAPDILAFARTDGKERYVAVLNRGWTQQRITVPVTDGGNRTLTDVLTGQAHAVKSGSVTLTLEPQSGVVLR